MEEDYKQKERYEKQREKTIKAEKNLLKEKSKHKSKFLKGKLLSKPKESIKDISSKKILNQFSRTNYGEIKEGKDYSQSPVQDRSNLFFQTLNRERQINRGWLQ